LGIQGGFVVPAGAVLVVDEDVDPAAGELEDKGAAGPAEYLGEGGQGEGEALSPQSFFFVVHHQLSSFLVLSRVEVEQYVEEVLVVFPGDVQAEPL